MKHDCFSKLSQSVIQFPSLSPNLKKNNSDQLTEVHYHPPMLNCNFLFLNIKVIYNTGFCNFFWGSYNVGLKPNKEIGNPARFQHANLTLQN